MSKNPLINALSAFAYISLIVAIINFAMRFASKRPDTILAPLAMISLFTLSAAVMGFIFGYWPGRLYLEDKKKEAVTLFLKTVGVFGSITILLFVLIFAGVFS